MTEFRQRSVKVWDVPRPGPDGEPLGVLRVNVVALSEYERLVAFIDTVGRTCPSSATIDKFLQEVTNYR
jgi:hypothetical protein